MVRRLGLALLLVSGCGDDAVLPPEPAPDSGCRPGTRAVEARCEPAGIPADACPPGWTSDADSGCLPILPAEPCAPGTMALPGETSCREVAPCPEATWGDAPMDAGTQFVDAS